MAAADIEDDETWLYGDAEGKENKDDKAVQGNSDEESKNSQLSVSAAPFNPKTSEATENGEDKEAGELSGEEDGGTKTKKESGVQEEEEEDSDDDDDDDVQITIGDIKTAPSYESRSIFKGGTTTYQKPAATSQTPKTQQTKGVDLDAVGTVNGVPVFEFDLDSLQAEERPWRKPGADITDYFNYGFNEDTWRQYCEKQRRLRMENNSSGKLFIPPAATTVKPTTPKATNNTTAPGTDAADATSPGFGRKAGPPPGRKMSGTIDVIGSTLRDSRRPTMQYENAYEQDSKDYKKPYVIGSAPGMPPPHGVPPPHITPNFGVPPPGPVPPPGMPPPGLPPPGVPPPPGVSVPPPGFPPSSDRYDPYYSAPAGMPPDRPPYDDRPPYGYDDPYRGPPPFHGAPPPAAWDTRPTGGYGGSWEYSREGPPRSDSDISSSEDERESRRYDYRGRDYDRDRERSYRRERSDRSRSRDRDRDRERRHRDREDRHKRRKHRDGDEDSEHRSSRHKKSKRSKKEKEEEPAEASASQTEESSK